MTAVRARLTRRRLALLAALAVLAVAVAVTGGGERARATSGGSPYEVPSVVDTNPAPDVVETTLVADETMVDIGNGVQAKAFTYNGTVPGPNFHLKVGDTVIATLENRLDDSQTSIHWHGIELNNFSDGTPVTQNTVPPGGKYRYEFQVLRPGVYWYHPHFEGSTNQVFRGLEGSIYVTDAQGAEAGLQGERVLPPESSTKTLMLGDTTVCKAPGSNDATTYPNDPNLPWAGGPVFMPQGPPGPRQLCETNPVDDHGNPRPEGAFAAGEIPNVWGIGQANAPEGQTVLTNGKNVGARAGSPEAPGPVAPGASLLPVAPGSGIRLRLINGAHSRYFRLRLTDSAGAQIPLVRVGGEGGLLDRAILEGGSPGGFQTKFDVGEIVIGPSERADVVAAIPATATGVATMWTLDYNRLGTFSGVPTVPVMHLDVTGSPATPQYTIFGAPPGLPTTLGTPVLAAVNQPVQPLDVATGTLLDPATFVPMKPGSPAERIRMTAGTAAQRPFSWSIDGVPGPHDTHEGYATTPRIVTTRYGRLGDIIDLSVENATEVHHPFHWHGFSFQPIRFEWNGVGSPRAPYEFPYNEFVDVVDIPPGYVLHFRVLIEDRKHQDRITPGGGLGRWMFHCHIFPHQTGGLMSEFIVVRPDGDERPNIDTPVTAVTAEVGQAVTVTGNISDPDGDPVALRASVGTVTDNGNGTWTWTYTPQSRPDEPQAVYITARDPDGLEGQASFGLVLPQLLGYRLVGGDGGIFSFGRAFHGSTGGLALNSPIVGGATNPVGSDGYWTVAADGGVFSFNAPFLGSLGGQPISAPAVAIEPSPTGQGYWIVLADGKVQAFGDATPAGDLAGEVLNAPIIAMASTPTGDGYWLVAEDGGIFTFGDAGFFGSTGGLPLNAPVIDVTPAPDGQGYNLTASDGGVFSYGTATFMGSTGGLPLNAPIVGMLAAPGGYWLAAADGGVFTFGAIPFLGSVGGSPLNAPVLDIIS